MGPELTSARVPPLGPSDHVQGDGPEAVVYVDLGCPHCAAAWPRIRELPLRLCVRHFPVASRHPRAPALHAAAEAAAAQREEAFWEMCDSIYADHGHVDDPHLWRRAERLGLDLGRFERERRSQPVGERVRADFLGGIRAGVTHTPAAYVRGRAAEGAAVDALAALSPP